MAAILEGFLNLILIVKLVSLILLSCLRVELRGTLGNVEARSVHAGVVLLLLLLGIDILILV